MSGCLRLATVLAFLCLCALAVHGARKAPKDLDAWLAENDVASGKAADATPTPAPTSVPVMDAGDELRCPPDATYRFPFKPRRKLPFCSEYQELSCCDSKDAKGIARTVSELVSTDCAACHAVFTALKCSQCSPHASRFWLDDASSIRLCEDYCLALFDLCADIPFDATRVNADGTSAAFYINANGIDARAFCEPLVAPEPGCYRAPVPAARDTACKCPSHDCIDEAAVAAQNRAARNEHNKINMGSFEL